MRKLQVAIEEASPALQRTWIIFPPNYRAGWSRDWEAEFNLLSSGRTNETTLERWTSHFKVIPGSSRVWVSEAKSLTSLGWRSLPRGDGDSWDVPEPSSIWGATLGLGEALRCLLRVAIGDFVSAPSPERISPFAVALAVILPILGLLIVAGICLIWKQRRSKGN